MGTKQNLLKGAMILSIGVMLSKIIGLVYRIPLTNIIGDQGNGYYSSAYQVYVILLTLTATAIPSGLSKLVAEREALGKHKEAQHIFKLTLRLGLVGAFVLALAVFIGADWISDAFFPDEHVGFPIRVLVPTILIMTVVAGIRGYFQGLGNMVPTALSQVVEQIFHVIFTVILAYYLMNSSLMAAVAGATFGTTIGALAALLVLGIVYVRARKERQQVLQVQKLFHPEPNKVIFKQIMEIMFPIVVSTCIFSVMTFIDLSMISNLLPESLRQLQEKGMLQSVPVLGAETLEVSILAASLKGQYGFQYNTFINIPISIIIQIAAVSIPAIAASAAMSKIDEVNSRIKQIFKLGMLIAAPVTAAFFLFGKPIIGLVLSRGTGGELLSAGAISLIFITIAQLSAAVLQAMGQPTRASLHAFIACLVKVILNYILIQVPEIHIFGVIYSTTVCYFVYGTLNVACLYKHFAVRLEWRQFFLKPLLCGGVMGLISYAFFMGCKQWLGHEKLSMLLVIPFAVLVYVGLIFATHTIEKKDIRGLRKTGGHTR